MWILPGPFLRMVIFMAQFKVLPGIGETKC
jgi:hypothetical protein